MSVGPRHVLCAVGSWTSFDEVAELTSEIGGTGVALDRDESVSHRLPGLERAFALAADRVAPSFLPADEAAVCAHTAVAFVVSPPVARHDAALQARTMLRLVSALFGIGGATAVKCESSGIAHGRARWLELARTVAGGRPRERDAALVDALVRKPLTDGRVTYSCGMHLLGQPDVELPSRMPADLAVSWMEAVGRRSLDLESGELRDGARLEVPGQPLRRARRRACDRYPEDDLFHNPFGYWDLSAEAAR